MTNTHKQPTFASISIIGLGYMGLPMAALLASKGHKVVGTDINQKAVAKINAGEAPFEEKGLTDLLASAHQQKTLTAHTTPQPADVFVIAVPTPFNDADKTPDMSYVEAAAKSLAPVLKTGNLVILESTSPVGATQKHVKAIIEAENPDLTNQIHYAFCPERAIPGDTVSEMVKNDRMVGGIDQKSTDLAINFYKLFVIGHVLPTTDQTAELVKLVENASRDVSIAFANELSHVCQTMGLDVWEVIKLANRHPRVNILQPGTGVGGHCIAVDPWFIINADPKNTPLMQAARQVNDHKPEAIIEQIKAATPKGGKIAILGLAFKPDVDDLRTSPALAVAQKLANHGYDILPVEPNLTSTDLFPKLYALKTALKTADSIAILVNHTAFKTLTKADFCGKPVINPVGLQYV